MATVDANVRVASSDTTDVFHVRSIAFFRELTRRRIRPVVPSFVLIEVACVVARRFRNQAAGQQAAARVGAHGLIRIVPLDEAMLALSIQLGSHYFLRGADALYAATAQVTGTALVTWDDELIRRAGALSPTDWLAANP